MHKLLCLLFISVLLSCRTGPSLPEDFFLTPPSAAPVWLATEYSGVKILKEMDDSLPVGGAALALRVGRFEVVLTPPDTTGRGETLSSSTSRFTLRSDVEIGVNGSPFSKEAPFNRTGWPMDIVGIQINDTVHVSSPVDSYDALYILSDGSMQIGSQAVIPKDTVTAIGGFRLLLKNGAVLGTRDARHPRTAVGLSRDGRTLYVAVFDGRQRNRAGLTTEETASWMKWLGCHTALNMDGGGSSSLVMKDRKGELHLLNSPIYHGRPGHERAVGNNMGFRFISP